MLSNEELAALIEVGVEIRGVEFKDAGSTNSKEFVALVARACIAVANQRDGGHVVVGVVDNDPGGGQGGLSEEQVREWLDHDTVMVRLNAYADPPLSLRLAQRELPTGAPVVVIEVAEFDEIPVLSARDFPKKIVRGQLYTRSMAKPESSAQNTQNELREVLQLATEKQLHTFLRTARQAGLAVGPADADQFASEAAAFFADPVASTVVGVPRLSASIRPNSFDAQRIAYDRLLPLVNTCAVRLRGWPFPFVEQPIHGGSWVAGVQTDWKAETWGMHESGQFQIVRPLPTGYGPDWSAQSEVSDGPYLPVWFPVLFIAEATLFAMRLQQAVSPEEEFVVEISLSDARGWTLVAADPKAPGFVAAYAFGSDHWQDTLAIPAGVTEDFTTVSAVLARELLLRFGWDGVSVDLIRGIQDAAFT